MSAAFINKNEIIERTFEKLVFNLEELTKHYRHLLDCVRKEKDLLISTKIEKLNENTQQKEQLLIKIKAVDGLRLNYARELANALQTDTQNPRLLDLAQKIGSPRGDRLRSLHSALEIIIKRLNELNAQNAQYAESGLKNVNEAMHSFKDSLMGQKTYQKKGQYQSGSEKSGHFVSKEA